MLEQSNCDRENVPAKCRLSFFYEAYTRSNLSHASCRKLSNRRTDYWRSNHDFPAVILLERFGYLIKVHV